MLNSGIYCQSHAKGRGRMQKKGLIVCLTFSMWLLMGTMALAAQSTYVVKSGDSLWKIAQACGVSVDRIKQLNGLSSDRLSIGQTLSLVGSAVNNSTPAPAVVSQPKASPGVTSTYVVVSGDSLWSIANKCGTSVEQIKALNALTSELLQVGAKLTISGSSPGPSPVPVSRSGDNLSGMTIIEDAAQYLGTPYRYGGAAPGGFDCSGFTTYVFNRAGINLPRTAAGQMDIGIAVEQGQLAAGDLVFFRCGGGGIDHVGIYCDNGRFIHSSSPRSGGVIYSSFSETYYSNSYAGARRIIR